LELKGRRVWLIGASSGIGAALVPALVREGVRLAITSRNEMALRALAAEHGRADAPVLVFPGDVTVTGALKQIESDVRRTWGATDVVIYNAGVWSAVDVDAIDLVNFEQQIAVNYVGMIRAVDAVLPDMLARGAGEIVGVGSLSAYGAFPRAEAYGSSKAAVNYMLQALRIDLTKRGIGVTTVNPGFVKTRLTDVNDFPMPFLLTPEAAAETIVEGLLAGKAEIHFPLRLSLPLKLITALPRPIYEWLVMRTVKR
jgi:short-subunit dehydrogenase